MAIESDRAEILSGVRHGETIGGPIALPHPEQATGTTGSRRCASSADAPPEPAARGAARSRVPGLVMPTSPARSKYGRVDLRDVLERASARETAARVAAGAIARQLLSPLRHPVRQPRLRAWSRCAATIRSPCASSARARSPSIRRSAAWTIELTAEMIAAIDRAREAGDTLGGAFEVIAPGVPPGPRQLRPVGSQARRTAGAGLHVDSGDQGGRHRPRPGGRGAARIADARRDRARRRRTPGRSGTGPPDQQRGRTRRRRHQRRGLCASPPT